ncbi:hypothetical protein PCE1_001807 [Barthelona sp. PCE]
MSDTVSYVDMARMLASNEVEQRESAFLQLTKFFETYDDADRLQMLRLWKGFFVGFCLVDKTDNQLKTADIVLEVVDKLSPFVLPVYLSAFWELITKEWHLYDKFTLDKFLSLMRRVFSATLRFIFSTSVDPMVFVKTYQDFLFEKPKAKGCTYHIFDVLSDELPRIVGEELVRNADNKEAVYDRAVIILEGFFMFSNKDKTIRTEKELRRVLTSLDEEIIGEVLEKINSEDWNLRHKYLTLIFEVLNANQSESEE